MRAFDTALDEDDSRHMAAALRVVRAANELMAPPHSARYTAPDQQYLRITPAELESFVTGPLASAIGAVEATGAVRSHRGRPERLVSRALG